MKKMKQIQRIILIGAMKSGTSSVFDHLKAHPEICVPPVKEPEFFSEQFAKTKYRTKSYDELFELNKNHRFTLDASTGYTKYPMEIGVPKRIYESGIKPKFLYIVRNPFDRICSHYNFMQQNMKWEKKITADHLIMVSNYYRQLEQYRFYFKKENFLILDFETFKKNYKSTIAQIYDFVGIEDYTIKDPLHSNRTKPVNRKYKKLQHRLGGRFMFLPEGLRTSIKNQFKKKYKEKYIRLSREEKEYVHSCLKDDMLLFQKEYNFDVTKWGFYEK